MSNQKQEMKLACSGASRAGLGAAIAAFAMVFVPAVHAAGAGMTITKDPVTGELRAPTADEFNALEKQQVKDKAAQAKANAKANGKAGPVAAKSADAVDPEIRLANGAVGYQLGDEFMTYSVVTRNADGTTLIDCVTGAEAANQLVKAPQSTTAKTNKSEKEHGHAH